MHPDARRPPRGAALAALALALLCAACAGETAPPPARWNGTPEGVKGASSGTRAEHYFPLVDGNVYLYATVAEDGGDGILVARVHRSDERHGELRFPTGARRFEYTDRGVVRADTGAFVLKEPLEVGATWPGEHGGRTRVVAIGAAIEVPAGRFSGCVQTVEERLGDRPVRYASTFCPDVGVVSLEAAGNAGYEKAELKSYAPPIDIGLDGLQRTQEAPPPAEPR